MNLMLNNILNASRNVAKFVPFGVLCAMEIKSGVQKFEQQCLDSFGNHHELIVYEPSNHNEYKIASEFLGCTYFEGGAELS